MSPERLNDLLVFPDNRLPRYGDDHFQISFAPVLPIPGNDGLVHVKGHALFQSPAQERQGLLGVSRQVVERQYENTHNQVRDQQRDGRAPVRNPREYAAQSRANHFGLRDVGFNRGRHYRPQRQRFDRDTIELPQALAPASCRHVLAGNLDDQRRMRHRVKPAVNAPDQSYAVELVRDAA